MELGVRAGDPSSGAPPNSPLAASLGHSRHVLEAVSEVYPLEGPQRGGPCLIRDPVTEIAGTPRAPTPELVIVIVGLLVGDVVVLSRSEPVLS